jgi:hypothetical protein
MSNNFHNDFNALLETACTISQQFKNNSNLVTYLRGSSLLLIRAGNS